MTRAYPWTRYLYAALLLGLACAASNAQRFGGGYRGSPDRSEYPMWENPRSFESDTFTFVRIQFDSTRGGGSWRNDFPDSDWNLSFRLQQLTSLKVDPEGLIIRLTDPRLKDYPFIFMSNVQNMSLSNAEAEALREYLLNGGFLMADDFWCHWAWENVQREMQRVLPKRKPRELTIDHPIFNLVYQFDEIPRVMSIRAWENGDRFEYWHTNGRPEPDEDPHFQGYFDDDGRLMALFCHNSDVGDGWEREGQNHEFFQQFSVKVSYPLGINIVTYAMTH